MRRSNPVSVMTATFIGEIVAGKITLEALMAGLKRIGFDGVEMFLRELIGEAKSLGRVRSLLNNNDLKLSCVSVFCDFVSTDAAVRKSAPERLRAGIETAGEFGCTRVMLAGSMLKEGISPVEGRKMIADGIVTEAEFARQAGVTVMVEDFGAAPTLICRAADCLEIIALAGGSQRVKFTFDTGNFVFVGEDPVKNLAVLQSVIHHVHVKAWRALAERQPGDSGEFGGYIGCPIGEGVVPNQRLVERIAAGGYDGWFSLECGAVSDALTTAKRDYQWLTRWLKQPYRGG